MFEDALFPGDVPPEYIEECNQQLQQEIFALPFNTYLVANLDGWKLYSSDALKRRYKESMYKMSRTKNIADDIGRMVDDKKIIPCWINKGIFRLITFKIFAPRGAQSIAGFFTNRENQIYLLIDNNMSFGFASNNLLASLTVHESMHMACSNQRGSFVSLFREELITYYNTMFEFIFQTKGDISKASQKIISFLFKSFEFPVNPSPAPLIKKYLRLMDEELRPFSTLSMEKFDQSLKDYIDYIRLYFFHGERFYKSIRDYAHIYQGLRKGYERGLGVKGNTSLMVQEMFYPSEIICIYAELTQRMSKVYRAFHKI